LNVVKGRRRGDPPLRTMRSVLCSKQCYPARRPDVRNGGRGTLQGAGFVLAGLATENERSLPPLDCRLDPARCRRDHIAPRLECAEEDGGDFEARCPVCGHDSFRVSKPNRSRYRNIWACACKRCRCDGGAIRAAMLRRDISRHCLGEYGGSDRKGIDADAARRLALAVRDILSTPQLPPADIRLVLAEAEGQEIPDAVKGGPKRPFVNFAIANGVGERQAYEAFDRWSRPSACPPLTGGVVADASHNTEPEGNVKPSSSEPQILAVSADGTPSILAETAENPASDSCGNRKTRPNMKPAA
jgi:hypothetical protein